MTNTDAQWFEIAREMIWIDLETTGLSAQLDVPLELGLILTDKWGHQIDFASWLIWEESEDFQAGIKRMNDNEFVRKMHEDNNLNRDLLDKTIVSRQTASDQAIEWLKSYDVEKFTLPMAGSSIGSLDRPFVQYHMPELGEFFHYRNIDVSSIREICKMHNPVLFESIKEGWSKEEAAHRVIDDANASISEYREYLDSFFFLED